MTDVLVVKDAAVQVVSDRAAGPLVVGGPTGSTMVFQGQQDAGITHVVERAPVVTRVQDRLNVVVGGASKATMVVANNMPGPKGKDLVDGVTYLTEATPQNASERETWFNPTTHSWRVFTNGAWQSLYSDGGFF